MGGEREGGSSTQPHLVEGRPETLPHVPLTWDSPPVCSSPPVQTGLPGSLAPPSSAGHLWWMNGHLTAPGVLCTYCAMHMYVPTYTHVHCVHVHIVCMYNCHVFAGCSSATDMCEVLTWFLLAHTSHVHVGHHVWDYHTRAVHNVA